MRGDELFLLPAGEGGSRSETDEGSVVDPDSPPVPSPFRAKTIASLSCAQALSRREREIVAAARAWLGTPYRHQASVKGQGADCLGLVRGVWREVVGGEPETLPAYSPDWAEVGGRETLLEAAGRWMAARPLNEMRAGDVVLFRMSEGAAVKHCAILSDVGGAEPRMIHAYWGRAVVESWMGPWWKKRLVAAFAWPAPRLGLAPLVGRG